MQTKNSTLRPSLNFILSRCGNIFIAALFVFLISSGQKSYGQICTSGTPSDTFNLTGHPDTTFNTAVIARGGGCCGNSNCADLYITLDANTVALSISVNGAPATGSFTMNIDCSNQSYSVGDLICLSGGGSHDITICKPGGNSYSFSVAASSAPTFPSSSTTRIGCSSSMNVGGLVESSITWQSVAPGNPGDYNSYLSCTSGCSSSVFTPLAGAPDSIDYQICGSVTASACTGVSQVCQTVRMYVEPGVTVVVNLPIVNLNCLNPIATIDAAAAAGTTLLWSPGGATTSSITVASANTYTVTATSNTYGCTTASATATSVVSADFSTPGLSCGSGIELTCASPTGTIGVTAVSGVTFAWSGLGIVGSSIGSSINVDAQGTYSVVATKTSSGCTQTCSIGVSQDFNSPNVTCGQGVNLTCTNPIGRIGASTISAVGVSFSWSGQGIVGSNTGDSINANTAGTYTVTATAGANGCVATCSIVVTQDFSTPGLSCGQADTLKCTHTIGTVGATAVSGVTFAWSGPGIIGSATGSTINMNVAGTYSVVATKTSSGCTQSCSIVVAQDFSTPNLSCGGGINLTCTNPSGTIGADAVLGVTFVWSGPGIVGSTTGSTINVNTAGTYSLVATKTLSGCTQTCSIGVTSDFSTPNLVCGQGYNLTCTHTTGNIGATAVPGVTFAWNGPGIIGSSTGNSINVGTAGTYSVVATKTSSGCVQTCSIGVTQDFSTPNLSCGKGDTLTCVHTIGTVKATAVSGVTFAWSGPGIVGSNTGSSVNMNLAGTYSVVATKTSSGCSQSCSIIVGQDFTVSPAHAGPDYTISCITPQVNLSANPIPPGVSYSWNAINGGHIVSGGSTATPLVNAAGCYVLTSTYNLSGCTSRDTACVTGNTIHPNCNIIAPAVVPDSNTAGYILTSNSTNTNTYQWSVTTLPSNDSWIITSATNGKSIIYTSGTGVAVFKLVVVNTTNGCADSCTLAVGVNGIEFCMYGQGAYSNSGGMRCDGLRTPGFMTALLSTPLALGGGNNAITFYQSDVSCIIARMPGGGGFAALNGIATCGNPVGIQIFPHNGRFRNGLLAQTITYGLNLRICNIANVVIAGPYMVTYGSEGGNGCCATQGVAQGTEQTTVIPLDVWNYLKTTLGRNPTFLDVFNLANQALAGTYVPSGHTNPGLPDIAGAEDAISSAFDECRILAGFSTTPLRLDGDAGESTSGNSYEMSIKVLPNPFSNQTTIEMKPDADYDNVSVELYNITGARVSVLYHGAVESGITYSWVVDGTSLADGIYMYRIIADDDIYNGKMILIR